MNSPQLPPRRVVRVVLEMDVELSIPDADSVVPGPVARLMGRLISGQDQDALQATACYAALKGLEDRSELGKDILGTAKLEQLIHTVLASSGNDAKWFNRILELETERDARAGRRVAGGTADDDEIVSPEDDVLNPDKGWFNEVEIFLGEHWSSRVVRIQARTDPSEKTSSPD